MDRGFSGLVRRTWLGAGGLYYAELKLEHRNDTQVVSRPRPFEVGARVALEPDGAAYRVMAGT
jgi:hypothetical protein